MPKLCNLSRGRMCYIILVLSIVFFLSSVCTFAVLAMTKQATVKIKKTKSHQSHMQQRKIINRLKRIEERVKTKKGINKNDI